MNASNTAAIISVGDELTLGEKLDTNSMWIAARLGDLGIRVCEHLTVGDDRNAHVRALAGMSEQRAVVVCTGGLGPTADDLTRQALALAMGVELEVDAEALTWIRGRFERANRIMRPIQEVQALRPAGTICLPNANGTAPGLLGRIGQAMVFCLPGPPSEMRPMFDAEVAPRISGLAGVPQRTRCICLAGISEGDAAERLGELLARGRDPEIGITVSGGIISLRIRSAGKDATHRLGDAAQRCIAAVQPYAYADSGEGFINASSWDGSIERAVIERLIARKERIGTAESCTGGLVGQLLTSVPGSSGTFTGGVIAYSNDVKADQLGVPATLLLRHGAVSPECASAMAEGARSALGVHHALALTGIAGPAGGHEGKPVGTVWIACASAQLPTQTIGFLFSGDRHDIRIRAARTALAMLRFRLDQVTPCPPLLCEQARDPLPA